MQHTEPDLKRIEADLNASLMYNLSLTNKELFHSNFLAWLGRNEGTRLFFMEVIRRLTDDPEKDMAGIDLFKYNDWTVEREDKNFDLCIKRGVHYILVIENKVKAIPREDQLDEYVQKLEIEGSNPKDTRLLLLTLYLKFREYDPWMVKKYKDLAKAMEDSLKVIALHNDYEKNVIEDYINFITHMNNLAKGWRNQIVKQKAFAAPFDVEKAPGLKKLSDLYTKIQFSWYSEKLEKKLEKEQEEKLIHEGFPCFEIYNGGSNAINEEDCDPSKLYVDVHYGYANKSHQGILDVAIPVDNLKNPKLKYGTVKPRFSIKIQIEGRQYRRALDTDVREDATDWKDWVDDNLFKIGISPFFTTPGDFHFFSLNPKENPDVPSYRGSIFEKKLYPDNSDKITKKRPFNTYSNRNKHVAFIYQSRRIKSNTPVDEVLSKIVDDVWWIIDALRK